MKTEQNRSQVTLIGIGMGNPGTLTIQAAQKIRESDCLIGAQRMLDSFPEFPGKRVCLIAPEKIADYLSHHPEHQQIAVLFSGDVGFYSGAKKLRACLKHLPVESIPGISSLQYFCARQNLSWEGIKVLSLHGRKANLIAEATRNERLFLLTGPNYPIGELCKDLTQHGLGTVQVIVGEALSYPEENFISDRAEALQAREFHPLSAVMIENPAPVQPPYATHGLEDEEFLRSPPHSDRPVPITKSEIRSVSLSKLKLQRNSIVYDIGAGTGSVSVEAALLTTDGAVYAVEQNPDAVNLLKQNLKKFRLPNLIPISGKAPDALASLPPPDCVFIGGSSGKLKEMIQVILQKNPKVRLVLNAITLETVTEAIQCFSQKQFEQVELVQMTVAKAKEIGSKENPSHMMMGQNPIWILSGQGKGPYQSEREGE